MEHKGPDVDARDNLVVYQSLLQLVGRLITSLDGKFFDLCQLCGERLVAPVGT